MSIHLTPGRLALRAALLGLAAASVAGGMAAAPATADPGGTGLVISEVYGAGGNAGALYNADFVELYNPTAAPLDLAGLAVHYRSAGGGSGGTPFALTGSVPAGAHWLIRMSAPGVNGAALPTPDATAAPAFSMAAGGGQVALQQGTTIIATSGNTVGVTGIVDFVGALGAASFETAPTTSAATAAQSLNRGAAGADTDSNAADFSLAAPSPESAGPPAPAPLAATSPGDRTGQVGVAAAGFTLAATGGATPYSWTATGLPPGVSVAPDGSVSGTPTTAGTYPVTATVTDSATPTAATDEVGFTYTIAEAAVLRPIAEIQGDGAATPLAGQQVRTTGVVTAAFPTGGFNGLYIQTPGAETPGASDGIFVFQPGFDAGIAVGDSVEVVGTAKEFSGLTEIEVGAAGSITELTDSLGEVTPKAVLPGTDCALPGDACLSGAALEAAKEAAEGELFRPTADYTATDVYDGSAYNPPGSPQSSFFGEIGLAADSDVPLYSPTEVADAQDTAAVAARTAYNNAHRVVLDDGSSTTYWNTANTAAGQDTPFPWYTPENQPRVGAAVTFAEPVVLDYRFGWKVQPTHQVTDDGSADVSFEQTRKATPEPVGGDLQLATFNVLNYFTTFGDGFPGGCVAFLDRDDNPISTRSCMAGNGPRGAWNQVSFERQQTKIVNAINALDADIVSLEEIENSRVVDDHDRDEAVGALVDALNADAGSTRWAYAESPAELPAVLDEDVIRTGFIYDPETLETVGEAKILIGSAAFGNAREPLAQAFRPRGGTDAQTFAVIVNHFKSKGSGVDDGTGQGNANPDRIAQARALKAFAAEFAASSGTDKVFLTGDFNAYSMEDPVQELEGAGYTSLESTADPAERSYSFDGASGSLDHVFASPGAVDWVTGVDIWEINANETVFNQYSRFNYNAAQLYDGTTPFSASDHNPEIVGIDVPGYPVPVTLTATASPTKLKARTDTAEVRVTITPGAYADGAVSAYLGDERLATSEASAGEASLTVGPFDTKGKKLIEIRYAGDAATQPATTYVELKVQR